MFFEVLSHDKCLTWWIKSSLPESFLVSLETIFSVKIRIFPWKDSQSSQTPFLLIQKDPSWTDSKGQWWPELRHRFGKLYRLHLWRRPSMMCLNFSKGHSPAQAPVSSSTNIQQTAYLHQLFCRLPRTPNQRINLFKPLAHHFPKHPQILFHIRPHHPFIIAPDLAQPLKLINGVLDLVGEMVEGVNWLPSVLELLDFDDEQVGGDWFEVSEVVFVVLLLEGVAAAPEVNFARVQVVGEGGDAGVVAALLVLFYDFFVDFGRHELCFSLKTYYDFWICRYFLSVFVVNGRNLFPVYEHPFHLCETVIDFRLLVVELDLQRKRYSFLPLYQPCINFFRLFRLHGHQETPHPRFHHKPNLIIKAGILPDIRMRDRNNLRVNRAHQINSIGGDVHNIGFVVG